ncbi:hypothetical protein PsorP6_009281 [Peronosclerospora sorghi]|uniref:Uncharacterized protein n=1 Tax=Peronosclerospora sorghi TaxID=230839 RepID=A0ACC0VYH0_9STRA|nr:hypothetical protein PsorP6_009281 [Peronosclerospora sorghi]
MMQNKEEATSNMMALVDELRAHKHKIEIYWEWTNPYLPEENDLVEKLNNVMLTRIRVVLTAADMLDERWGEAFYFVVEIYNVTPPKALDGYTPHHQLHDKEPDLIILHT